MPLPELPRLRSIHLNGADFAYVEQGSGIPVIFLHGSFSDHRVWEKQRSVVAQRYRFIAVDMRYFGATPWVDTGERFSPQTHIADLAALIEALHLAPAYLVGRSYGAAIALATAVQHPARIRGLLLNEPPVSSLLTDPAGKALLAGELESFGKLLSAGDEHTPERVTELFYDWVNDRPGSFAALPEQDKVVPLANARTVPIHFKAPGVSVHCDEARALNMPITITRGALTRPFFRILAEAAHRCAPASELITLPGARHAAPNEQPEAFNAALLAFLERTSLSSLG